MGGLPAPAASAGPETAGVIFFRRMLGAVACSGRIARGVTISPALAFFGEAARERAALLAFEQP